MQITEIKVRKIFSEGPLRGFATVVFDNCFAVHGIKIIEAGGKSFAVFPSFKGRDGEPRNVAHPITGEFREYLEKELFAAYESAAEAAAKADSEESGNTETF